MFFYTGRRSGELYYDFDGFQYLDRYDAETVLPVVFLGTQVDFDGSFIARYGPEGAAANDNVYVLVKTTSSQVLNVLANDAGDIEIVDIPVQAGGTFGIGGGGAFINFLQDDNLSGVDVASCTYDVEDQSGTSDSADVFISITNQAPDITPVADINADEGDTINFTVVAIDPNGDDVTLQTPRDMPVGATYSTVTGIFNWVTTLADSGVYAPEFDATDDDGVPLTSTLIVNITVAEIGVPLVANDLTAAVPKNAVGFNIDVLGNDVGTNLSVVALGGSPTNCTPVISGDTLSVDVTMDPGLSGAGIASFDYTVQDIIGAQDTATVTIDVTNLAPVWTPYPSDASIEELENRNVVVTALDPDGDTITYAMRSPDLPVEATFNPTTRVFDWTPTLSDAAGSPYTVHFDATDDDTVPITTTATITLTVTDIGEPVVALPNTFVLDKNSLANVVCPLGNDVGISLVLTSVLESPGPTNCTPTINVNGLCADVDVAPSVSGIGVASFTYEVTDVEGNTDTALVTLDVTNLAPTFDAVGAQNANETELINFSVTAHANDGDTVTLTTSDISGLTGATFTPDVPGTDPSGVFDWTPGLADAGVYPVTFFATDDDSTPLQGSVIVTITVVDVSAPADAVNDVFNTFLKGSTGNIADVLANDTGAGLIITSAGPGVECDVTHDGAFVTVDLHAGAENPSFSYTIEDSSANSDTAFVAINPVNQLPVFTPLGAQAVLELDTLAFTVAASDPDGDVVVLSARNIPSGAIFDDQSGEFSWIPTLAQDGAYDVDFDATDDNTPTPGVTTLSVHITVTDLGPAANAQDDSYTLIKNSLANVLGVMSNDQGLGRALDSVSSAVNCTPTINGLNVWVDLGVGISGAGAASFDYTIIDQGGGSSSASVTIDVTNEAPTLAPIGDLSFTQGAAISVPVAAVDPDGDVLAWTLTPAPNGVTIVSTGNQSADIVWDGAGASGTFAGVVVGVNDQDPQNILYDFETIEITIGSGSSLNAINIDASITKNVTTRIEVLQAVTGGIPPYTVVSTGNDFGGTSAVSNDGLATDFAPALNVEGDNTGQYFYTIKDANGDFTSATVNVDIVNTPPVWDPVSALTVPIGSFLSITLRATDTDPPLELALLNVEPAAQWVGFIDNGDGSAVARVIFSDPGLYSMTFLATDEGGLGSVLTVSITATADRWTEAPIDDSPWAGREIDDTPFGGRDIL